jgi:hypothetical protein
MRWFMILLALATLTAAGAHAQVRFGPVAGLNRMSVSGDEPQDGSFTSTTGAGIGLFGEVSLGDHIYLCLQPGYANRKLTLQYEGFMAEAHDSLQWDIQQATLALLARIMLPGDAVFFTGGVQGSYLVSADVTDLVAGGERDISGSIAQLDFAVLAGFGGEIEFDPVVLLLELRYMHGLVNLGQGTDASATNGMPARFRLTGLEFLAGIAIQLGGGE